MKNHIMNLPEDKQYIGFSALMGILMSRYKISDREMEQYTAEARYKAEEASHE